MHFTPNKATGLDHLYVHNSILVIQYMFFIISVHAKNPNIFLTPTYIQHVLKFQVCTLACFLNMSNSVNKVNFYPYLAIE